MAVIAPVTAPTSSPIALPPAPRTAEETGLPFSFVCDLVLKVLYFNGSMLGRDIANHLCLPFSFIDTTSRFLADEGYCSSTGVHTATLDPGEPINAGMQHMISTTGRQRARELLEINQYAGPAPVPIADYTAMAERQSHVDGQVNRARLHDAFSHLVLSEVVLDHLGPALSARQAVFLYGPPGNGKTTIAEAAASLLGAPMFIPRALYVHGEVIRFYDPIHHEPIDRELPPHDRRWQLAKRPAVKVGGELTPRMLELGFDHTLGFYEASMQLKANGGLFLIDDFGRQQNMSPRDLLNRLIVPLEKKVDYLNIPRAGSSIPVPFTLSLIHIFLDTFLGHQLGDGVLSEILLGLVDGRVNLVTARARILGEVRVQVGLEVVDEVGVVIGFRRRPGIDRQLLVVGRDALGLGDVAARLHRLQDCLLAGLGDGVDGFVGAVEERVIRRW